MLREDLERTLRSTRGPKDYDVLIALSGGKDSTYLLHRIKKEYGLRILAVSVDTGFLSSVAIDNIKTIIQRIGVDHLFITPGSGFFLKLYRHFFNHKIGKDFVHSVCYACGCVIEAIAIKYALQWEIPLIIQGYARWQPDNIFYEMPRNEIVNRDYFIPTHKKEMLQGPFTERDLESVLPSPDISFMDNVPRVLCPLHVWDYSVEDIRRTLQAENLIVKSKSSTLKTNCLLNIPMLYLDYNINGYNPYIFELSCLIREGHVKKEEWKNKMAIGNFLFKTRIFSLPILKDIEKKLAISFDDILAIHKG
ncbi:MAG: hypothetical protein JXA30_02965 [Deltaproteobacteria bacterium]|nr:hypothetical protein [Deltaproteobacteria bacterium]